MVLIVEYGVQLPGKMKHLWKFYTFINSFSLQVPAESLKNPSYILLTLYKICYRKKHYGL